MTLRTKFLAVESELNATFLERREPTRGLLVGLLSSSHVLLLGPPGTAKSAEVEDLCSRIGGQYFRWLLSRTSTPEELFGPISLKSLEADRYERVTSGKLPEANVTFLDEIFKCNSAVLNGLLSLLNERLFFNNGTPVRVPLEMAVGASNELPEDREELSALWDRFSLRYVVGYLRDPRSFEALLAGSNGASKTTIAAAELAQAQAEAAQIDASKVLPILMTLRQRSIEMAIAVSDRRWKQCLGLIRANAWLNGRTEAADDDLDVLAGALWQEPSQILPIKQLIMSVANPINQEAVDLADQALEIFNGAMSAPDDRMTALGAEANVKLKRIAKRLEELRADAQSKGRDSNRVTEILAQTTAWNREVVAKCLGIDL